MGTHGAQNNGFSTGAYVLVNYFNNGGSGGYQVDQAIQAVGSGIGKLRFLAVDVEVCCGEFVSWQKSHAYALKNQIMDPASHMQRVIKAGTSGPTAPTWNDSGGTTTDGTVTWMDTGVTVLSRAARVRRISQAVSYIQALNPPIQAVVYTDRGNWAEITGNCDNGSANNCSNLISVPLWDVEHKKGGFIGPDGLRHCGDGIVGLLPFQPYSSASWQSRSGNQYDFGLYNPAPPATPCNGNALFGITAQDVDLDYFDPSVFPIAQSAAWPQ